jgi:hypothetical protein
MTQIECPLKEMVDTLSYFGPCALVAIRVMFAKVRFCGVTPGECQSWPALSVQSLTVPEANIVDPVCIEITHKRSTLYILSVLDTYFPALAN